MNKFVTRPSRQKVFTLGLDGCAGVKPLDELMPGMSPGKHVVIRSPKEVEAEV